MKGVLKVLLLKHPFIMNICLHTIFNLFQKVC